IDDVRGVSHSHRYRADVRTGPLPSEETPRWLAATTELATFRAAWIGRGPDDEGVVLLSEDEARRLDITSGETLRILDTLEVA
ncbi:MAG: arginine N-succinyltransferase, partial [Halomonas sp.]